MEDLGNQIKPKKVKREKDIRELISSYLIAGIDVDQRLGLNTTPSFLSEINIVLPAELLSKIFIHCLPCFPVDPSPYQAPLLLTQICRLWRDTAHSTPQLWSSLILHIYSDCTESSCEAMLSRSWLSRSGDLPLSLKLSFHRDMLLRDIEHNPLFQLVCSYAPRWKDIHIFIRTEGAIRSLSAVSGQLTSLESLDIDLGILAHNQINPTDVFQDAPRLRSITIQVDFDSVSLYAFKLPWISITSLDIMSFYSDDKSFAILGQCRNLVTLRLVSLGDPSGREDRLAPIEFSQLRTLNLGVSISARRVFRYLSTPVLNHLDLSQTSMGGFVERVSGPWVAGNDFHSFLGRSKGSITSLSLSLVAGAEFLPHDLARYLTETPNLKEFSLRDHGAHALTAETLQRLTPGTPDCLVPRMQTLVISCSWENFPDEACAEMISRRVACDPRTLRSIQLFCEDDRAHRRPIATASALRRCAQQGVTARLASHGPTPL
ncbi:hypothetical protein HWV62_8563 [Athelia sp. TMB]|nr:hypothetical protein HWV62_8563 [Athelia sp. TMB]